MPPAYVADKNTLGIKQAVVVNIDGSTTILLKISGSMTLGASGINLPWSEKLTITPDSSRVIFITKKDSLTKEELYSAKIDGSDKRKLNVDLGTLDFVTDYKLAGSFFVYRVYKDDHTQLYKVKSDGTNDRRLHGDLIGQQNVGNHFVITSDGTRVYYNINLSQLLKTNLYWTDIQ